MQVAIIGAGISGLTLAKSLTDSGIKTVIIERESTVGGLARSFKYDNGATFDMGPHRFLTEDSVVNKFILDTLIDNYIFIERNSKLFICEKYLSWPVALKEVMFLCPYLCFSSGLDLFFRKKADTESFEDYIIEKYGNFLYKNFFKSYTEKFTNQKCSSLHRDWAITGINRATIDRQFDSGSLPSLIKSVLLSSRSRVKFIYPQTGGVGAFSDILASKIKENGGRILLSNKIAKFTSNCQKINTIITDQGEAITVDHIFWSGSLMSLRSLGKAPDTVPRLNYISSVFFNYLITSQIEQDFQWCYFGDKKFRIDRVSMPGKFNPCLIPKGKNGLCLEASSIDGMINGKESIQNMDRPDDFLLQAKLIKTLDQIVDCRVEYVRETYPLYMLNYPYELKEVFNWIKGKWSNLTLIGRSGRFWYNNMDNSIAAALKVSELFLSDAEKGFLRDGEAYSVEDRYLTGL